MTSRLFTCFRLPEEITDSVERFLEPRPQVRWTLPQTWHVTLSYMPDVDGYHEDELVEALTARCERLSPAPVSLSGFAGFPNPSKALSIGLAVDDREGDADRAAQALRTTARRLGITCDAKPFRPHVTLARSSCKPFATHWRELFDTFMSPEFTAREVVLVRSESHGANRPRHYEDVATFHLGPEPERPSYLERTLAWRAEQEARRAASAGRS